MFAGRARLFTVCRAHRVNERRGHEDIELRSLPFLSFHRVLYRMTTCTYEVQARRWVATRLWKGRISQCARSCVDTRASRSACPFHRGSATHAGVLVSERRSVSVAVQAAALQGGI